MFRTIRTETLRALRADHAELREAREQLAAARQEAELLNDSAIRAENTAENLLCGLGQAHADRIQAERERNKARLALDGRDRAEAEALAGIRTDLDRLIADAADTERGPSVRGALALGAFRRLVAAARKKGELPPEMYMLAVVLDLADDQADDVEVDDVGDSPGSLAGAR